MQRFNCIEIERQRENFELVQRSTKQGSSHRHIWFGASAVSVRIWLAVVLVYLSGLRGDIFSVPMAIAACHEGF
jgi:hypothetical protein